MKTILIIEDNNDIRESTAEILELAGYTVLQGENGKSGVDLAYQNKPDMILCDIMMPELDGYGATREIRRWESMNSSAGRTPIIALTANAFKGDQDECLAAGMDDYLTKPVTKEAIRLVLEKWAPPLHADSLKYK